MYLKCQKGEAVWANNGTLNMGESRELRVGAMGISWIVLAAHMASLCQEIDKHCLPYQYSAAEVLDT